jgi:hypothetical protein
MGVTLRHGWLSSLKGLERSRHPHAGLLQTYRIVPHQSTKEQTEEKSKRAEEKSRRGTTVR